MFKGLRKAMEDVRRVRQLREYCEKNPEECRRIQKEVQTLIRPDYFEYAQVAFHEIVRQRQRIAELEGKLRALGIENP